MRSLPAFFVGHCQKHCINVARYASCYPSHDSNFKRAVFTSPVHLDHIVTFLRFDVFNGHKRAECDVARVDG